MGAKKNDKKGAVEEDHSTKELSTIYKKTCKELEIPINKPLNLKITELLVDNAHLNQILINDINFGTIGVKALFKSLLATK